MQKTKREIIDETVKAYTLDTLARDNMGLCQYLTPSGRKCAVGRCCREPKNYWKGVVGTIRVDLSAFGKPDAVLDLEAELKPEYRGHELDFWRDLQRLHDSKGNWVQSGLSPEGEEFVKILIREWCKDE